MKFKIGQKVKLKPYSDIDKKWKSISHSIYGIPVEAYEEFRNRNNLSVIEIEAVVSTNTYKIQSGVFSSMHWWFPEDFILNSKLLDDNLFIL
jgi:hypothetical protein